NRVGFARQAYNDQVLEFNDAAAQFPTLIVARLFGFFLKALVKILTMGHTIGAENYHPS
ncbi:MAG: hypothetical protein EOP51_05960, partial [Sphingobacteriales bacterium]